MSSFVLKDAAVRYGGRDITGVLNTITMEYGAELQDSTPVNSATRRRVPGLLDAKVNYNGFWDEGFDESFFLRIGNATEEIVSIAPNNPVIGERAFTMATHQASYNKSGNVGDLAQVVLNLEGNSTLVRGKVAVNTDIIANGNSGGILLDSVPAGGFVHVSVHVTAIDGTNTPTINFFLDSSATIGFGASTERIALDAMTAIGAQRDFLAGAITDEFWRLRWTISGTDPSFSAFAVIGITQ